MGGQEREAVGVWRERTGMRRRAGVAEERVAETMPKAVEAKAAAKTVSVVLAEVPMVGVVRGPGW